MQSLLKKLLKKLSLLEYEHCLVGENVSQESQMSMWLLSRIPLITLLIDYKTQVPASNVIQGKCNENRVTFKELCRSVSMSTPLAVLLLDKESIFR